MTFLKRRYSITNDSMKSELVDLHVHTTFSDGTFIPRKVVKYAIKRGLKAIAITDHDTIDGNEEATAEGKIFGFEVIPGIEISVGSKYGSMHILGYYIDWRNELLRTRLREVAQFRRERNFTIIERLKALGMMVEYSEVKRIAEVGSIGRPHFAQLLLEKGYAKSIKEAFEKYLRRGAPAYVEKKRITPAEGISLIKKAGGVAVLAHPVSLEISNPKELENVLKELIDLGIEGIEVYYSTHTPEETAKFKKLAERHGLLITGGTDFHGEAKPEIEIGVGMGNMKVEYSVVEDLKKELKVSKIS